MWYVLENESDLNEITYDGRIQQKTPAVIVQDDVYSSDFLNAKQSNKSIKLINIENSNNKSGKRRGEILYSPKTNNDDGVGLSEMNDDYRSNRGGL